MIIDFIVLFNFSIFIFILNIIMTLIKGIKKEPSLYCGIVGFSGKNNFDVSKVEILGLINDMQRGGDSVGIYTPSMGIKKDTENALSFFLNVKNNVEPDKLLISHYRKKSVGSNTVNNAHPYKEEGLILCHNGTLTDYYKLSREYDISYSDWNTDSHLLTFILGKSFEDGKYPEILERYSGSAALLFSRENEDSLYMYRDYNRPLFYGIIEEEGIYISSIKDSLAYIGCKDITAVPTEKIVKIQNGEIVDKISKPVKQITSSYNNTSNYNNTSFKNFNNNVNRYTRLATSSDIEEDILYINGVPSYTYRFNNDSKQYTGISLQAIRPEMLVGFYVRYTGNTVRNKDYNKFNFASLTKGDYYKIVGVAEGVEKINVIDDNNRIAVRDINSFDYYNFIPVKGMMVKLVSNISTVNGEEPAGNKEDPVVVTEYSFGDKTMSIFNISLGKTFKIPFNLVRTMSEDEYIETEKQLKKQKENNAEIVEKQESQVEIIEEDDNDNFYGEEIITSDVLYAVLSDICSYVDDIKCNYNKNKDILENIEKLENYILECFDINKVIEKIERE